MSKAYWVGDLVIVASGFVPEIEETLSKGLSDEIV